MVGKQLVSRITGLSLVLALVLLTPHKALCDSQLAKNTVNDKPLRSSEKVEPASVPQSNWSKRQAKLLVGQDVSGFGNTAGKVVKGFCYALATFLLLVSLYKRFFKLASDSNSKNLEIVDRYQLGPKALLLVAKVREREFLLAQSGDDIKLLTELKEQITFSESLERLSEGENGSGTTDNNMSFAMHG